MSVSVNYTSNLTVVEALENNVAALSDKSLTHALFNTVLGSQNALSTPPCVAVASFEQALADGAATIDLTSLLAANGAELDGSGLRVQFLKIKNKSSNANPITIAQGASNGYNGFGTDFSLTLSPNGEALLRTLDSGSDIGAANCELDLSGTGAQILQVEIVLG